MGGIPAILPAGARFWQIDSGYKRHTMKEERELEVRDEAKDR